MGATTFDVLSTGSGPKEAFRKAVDRACYDHGHSGYTGTIAEKSEFINIRLPDGADPYEYVNKLINDCDERIDDKWGPAGCLEITGSTYAIEAGAPSDDKAYLFFGWASC